MGTVFLIIANLFVYNVWIWFVNRLLQFHNKKAPIILGLIFCGIISTAAMVCYHPLLGLANFAQAGFSDTTTFSSYIVYLLYLVAILYVVYVFTAHIRKREYIQGVIFLAIWVLITILGTIGIIKGVIVYYVFIAFGEEFLKYYLGNVLFQRFKISPRDIIIFAILSALGFAIVENFLYIIDNPAADTLGGANKILLQRGIITGALHASFTGLIGYGAYYFDQNKTWFFVAALIGGIIFHGSYDIAMFNSIIILMPVFLIGSYLLLSYLAFQSDILYKQTST